MTKTTGVSQVPDCTYVSILYQYYCMTNSKLDQNCLHCRTSINVHVYVCVSQFPNDNHLKQPQEDTFGTASFKMKP